MATAINSLLASNQMAEASFKFQNIISFVNLAHNPKIEYKPSATLSSSRPFVSFVRSP
jgi:hypothetical protein